FPHNDVSLKRKDWKNRTNIAHQPQNGTFAGWQVTFFCSDRTKHQTGQPDTSDQLASVQTHTLAGNSVVYRSFTTFRNRKNA
ncbi:MAG: hypothetical protein ACK5DM_13020, partial [Planctomyces sp.]